jgi:hypothetical protein
MVPYHSDRGIVFAQAQIDTHLKLVWIVPDQVDKRFTLHAGKARRR